MSLDDQPDPPRPSGWPPPASDARRLRALTHPVRMALVGQLVLHGALTATEAGELIGESPTTCSFHLRQLAKYGFVEEAGGGKGRARPWRMTTVGLSIRASEDPEAQLAQDALLRMGRERQLGEYWTWLQTRRSYPRRWQEAAEDSAYVFYLTAEELRQVKEQMTGLLQPLFRERMADPSKRSAGSVPVSLLLFAFPTEYPPAADPQAGHEGEGTPG